MKIKVAELINTALNLAVAKCKGCEPVFNPVFNGRIRYGWYDSAIGHAIKKYSTDWNHGGPIIECEKIEVTPFPDGEWRGSKCVQKEDSYSPGDYMEAVSHQYGPTPLIAAMRCYVASKLGDEVEVPNELLEGQE